MIFEVKFLTKILTFKIIPNTKVSGLWLYFCLTIKVLTSLSHRLEYRICFISAVRIQIFLHLLSPSESRRFGPPFCLCSFSHAFQSSSSSSLSLSPTKFEGSKSFNGCPAKPEPSFKFSLNSSRLHLPFQPLFFDHLVRLRFVARCLFFDHLVRLRFAARSLFLITLFILEFLFRLFFRLSNFFLCVWCLGLPFFSILCPKNNPVTKIPYRNICDVINVFSRIVT